jgi:hypothetical protein
MNKMIRRKRLNYARLYGAGALLLALLWGTSCADDYSDVPSPPDEAHVYMTLELNTGAVHSSGTRSLTPIEEKNIDNVSVLLFRRASSGEEGTLAYQAQTDEVQQEGNGKYTALVKLIQSVSTEEYSVMVIANCGKDVGYKYYGQTKSYVQQHLTYAYTDRWPANLDGKKDMKPFPMWGETSYEVLNKTSSFNGTKEIRMLRALARMDVGLKYKKTSSAENFEGIKGYRLETVHVYRVPNKGFVIPEATNYSDTLVSAPSVPSDISLLQPGITGKGDEGLTYTAGIQGTESGVVSGISHSIYLPENSVSTDSKNTTLVIGITDTISHRLRYYKLKMKSNTTSGKTEPVLRNYRYVYSVTAVTGMGYDTPEDALNGTDGGIDYSVIAWNDLNSDIWMSGQYYFKIDQKQMKLHAQTSHDATLHYETNLPFDRITWEWSKQEAPNTTYTESHPTGSTTEGVLTFHTENNSTGKALTNVLQFTAGDLTGSVTLVQASINMAYTIDCDAIKLVGSFMLDSIPDPNTQWIEVKIKDIDPEAVGLTWQLETDKQNGLWFHGEGTITSTEQDVILYADSYNGSDGKPLTMKDGGKYQFTITGNNFKADGVTKQNTCDEKVTVIVGYKRKTMLTVGGYATYGIWTSVKCSPYYYLTSSINYSFDKDAIFPCEGITIDATESASTAKALTELNKDPDIVYIAHDFIWTPSSDFGKAISEYVNKGGVVIYTNIDNDASSGIRTITDTLVSQGAESNHGPYTIKKNSTIPNDDPIYTGKVPGVKNPISLEGRILASDEAGDNKLSVKAEGKDQFVVYATYKDDPNDWRFVRYKRKNVVIITDGAFALSLVTATGSGGLFAIQSTTNPRPAKGGYLSQKAENCQIFENIMHWAIYQAEFHGINSGGLDPFAN